VLINYEEPGKNVYEVTEEYYLFNGQNANLEDAVFLINGIPVLVIECKNATKDEAIAIGIDQIRRYQRETPEFFCPEQIFTEQNEELNKYILAQHQKTAVVKVVERAIDLKKTRGLVWHTQKPTVPQEAI
jgi:type I restriction enzyme R subunit